MLDASLTIPFLLMCEDECIGAYHTLTLAREAKKDQDRRDVAIYYAHGNVLELVDEGI